MKRQVAATLLVGLCLAAGSAPMFAQCAPPAQAPAAAGAMVRGEAMRLIEDAETKIVRLAEAMPAEKYTWRPSEGVRSVSEVFLHMAGGNFSIPARLGTPRPADFNPQGFDKSTTEKIAVVAKVRESFEHVRQALAKINDADVEKTAQWFGGRQATYREIMFFLATHQHEHLGQAIAYARMNNIVPPWTEEAQQRQQQRPPGKNP